jgi:hypothetical protein
MSHIINHIKKYNDIHIDDILVKLAKDFKIVQNESLCMLKYVNKMDSNDTIRKTRGIILDKQSKKIVSYPLEGKISLEVFKSLVDWKDVVIEESIDGTLINMYYYNNTWNYSTNSTLNANCYWNSKHSFKELFIDTLKLYNFNKEILNKNYTYSFILCHPETRNVSAYNEPKIYHILSRNLDTGKEICLNLHIPKPKILKLDEINKLHCYSYKDLFSYCSKLNYNKEGVMLFSKDRLYRTKIKGKNHIMVRNIRGNHSNIYYTILEAIRYNTHNRIQKFLKYFPEYITTYNTIKKKIDLLCSELLHEYTEIKKNKNKQFRNTYKYNKAIKELHSQYIFLIKSYKPTIHSYKPNINNKKVYHYITKEMDITYLVYLLSTL